MTVKELCDLLEPDTNGDLPVIVRCKWHGETPAHDQFDIDFAVEVLEPDTADHVIVLECRQDG